MAHSCLCCPLRPMESKQREAGGSGTSGATDKREIQGETRVPREFRPSLAPLQGCGNRVRRCCQKGIAWGGGGEGERESIRLGAERKV